MKHFLKLLVNISLNGIILNKGLPHLAQNISHCNKKEKFALIFKCKFLIMKKTADKKIGGFSSLFMWLFSRDFALCGAKHSDENEFMFSASELDSPFVWVYLVLSAISFAIFKMNSSADIVPISPSLRERTATVPASSSLPPTTSI